MRHGKIAVVLMGLLAGYSLARSKEVKAPEHVSLRLDWLAGANHSGIFLALKRGYYAEAGIDLEILDGRGSLATLQAIAAGNDLIGMASLATMQIAVAKGMPVVAIAGIVQRSPDAVIALKGSGIAKPKDVEGKRWGVVPDASFSRSFLAFAAANSINVDTVTRVQVSSSTLYSALLQGNVDFITGWATNDALKVARQKPIETPIVFADHGANMLGTGIVVTRSTLGNRGDLLRAFLDATSRGAREASSNPTEAVEAIALARPGIDRELIAAELKALPEFQHTQNSAGHPFGWMSDADWSQTQEILRKYFDLSDTVDVKQLYTNALLPK